MIIFSFPGYEEIANDVSKRLGIEYGKMDLHHFPDGESYIKINSDVKNKEVILFCGLDNPDSKIMPLMYFAQTAREFGAKRIGLVAPYLGYMRMDKRFNDGEAVTSNIFAKFLSTQIDSLVTIDPHLHRHKSLEEIYSINCHVLHAADLIASWIKDNVPKPLLIGPDEESKQWVASIASKIDAPFVILNKIRHGDKDVEISAPQIKQYQDFTPILIDDIISTARTIIGTVNHLKNLKTKPPICIGIHAIFAGNAYVDLQNSGVEKIVTCNTIKHVSNKINVSDLIVDHLKNFI